ncbi:ATP-dependent Clp protease ATP-binding subunit CLPT2, chloroplastic-like isoform X1 [Zingiber officinale]|uniref:ATP-dependent Clp protease ATP-binding subunit CLPT2, chloroplastic-like isoform X1 n=1 Tax=Zingiber officinale TaxID=94328 RepID=UPI001C4BE352|nr:ATP-dependent Clp protease ATP-binding subunit CLPT2, chloroplastic-like isoform X1 [Zingiber officinale]
MAAGLLSIPQIPMPASTPSNRPTRLSVSVSVSVLPNAFFISPMRPPFPLSSLRSSALVFALPTAKPEMAAAEKMPNCEWCRWSLSAIKSFALAEVEARRLKYPTAGTEALLMGILVEGTNDASRFLHANGITLFKVREETVKLLGKSDLFFVSPEEIPLTESAQRALDKAIDEKLKSVGEEGETTTIHMLLGIWSEKEEPGYKILASLGFNDHKASELAKVDNSGSVTKT